jgi:hypothetical protein
MDTLHDIARRYDGFPSLLFAIGQLSDLLLRPESAPRNSVLIGCEWNDLCADINWMIINH